MTPFGRVVSVFANICITCGSKYNGDETHFLVLFIYSSLYNVKSPFKAPYILYIICRTSVDKVLDLHAKGHGFKPTEPTCGPDWA